MASNTSNYSAFKTDNGDSDRNFNVLQSNLDKFTKLYASLFTQWQIFPMTIGATTAAPLKGSTSLDTAYYRRVGDTMVVKYDYSQNGAGTAGTGIYLFNLPLPYEIDPNKSPVTTTNQIGVVGGGGITDGVTPLALQVLIYSTKQVSLKTINPAPTDVTDATYPLSSAALNLSFSFQVPILGWNF